MQRLVTACAVLVTACAVLAAACGGSSGGGAGNGGAGSNGAGTVALRIHFPGQGHGAVRSNSPAFECTADCTQNISAGTHVHLAAVADSASQFGAWGGACSSTSRGCDLTVSADADVTVRFDGQPAPQGQVSLAVVVNGQGNVASRPPGIDCGQACHATFTAAVDLIPTPQAGWQFDGWGGGCTGPGACHLTPPGQAGQASPSSPPSSPSRPRPPPTAPGSCPTPSELP